MDIQILAVSINSHITLSSWTKVLVTEVFNVRRHCESQDGIALRDLG